jgi:PGF-CTERM protein
MAPTGSVPSRRAVLRGLGAGLGAGIGSVAVPGTAAARQEQGYTTPAVIVDIPEFDVEVLPGFFIHVDSRTNPSDATVADACDYPDWPPEESLAYDIWLIGRKANAQGSNRTTLYVSDDRSIPGGALYIVNNATRCSENYIGIQIEQINAGGSGPFTPRSYAEETPTEGAEQGDGDDGDTGVFGPGFGIGGALAGLLGGGWLAHRRRE